MNTFFAFIVPLIFGILGYTVSAVKVINEGNEALVERLGRFNRKLSPGPNLVFPYVESIVVEDTTREQVLDVPPQNAITKDNVAIKLDAVVYWKIMDLQKAYYEINNINLAIKNLVLTTLRSTIGHMELEETFYSTEQINKRVLKSLDEATFSWGIKVLRVEVQDLDPPKTVLESMEMQRASEIRKRATIVDAEATAESVQLILDVLKPQMTTTEVMQYLLAKRYVDANQELSLSPNSKVIFMDPKALNDALSELMYMPDVGQHQNNPNNPPPPGGNPPPSQPGNGSNPT